MNKHILIFDSGLGGTTILQEIQLRLPNLQYSYAMDNGAFPYGNKTDEFLTTRMLKLFNILIPYCQPDLVVIACNTASTLILENLRTQFNIPFVGVVPAIKPAAKLSKTKVIGLLATEATISREYIDQLTAEHAVDCKIIRLGSQKLVQIAENKIQGKPFNVDEIKVEFEHLMKDVDKTTLDENRIDVFILGCTHFPAIKDELTQIAPTSIQWIDSGEAIARRVEDLCHSIAPHQIAQKATVYLTKKDENGDKFETLQRFGISQNLTIEID